MENFLPELLKIHGCTKACLYLLHGDVDISFPTDFWLLEKIDPYCSGWLKLHGDHSSKKRKEKENNYGVSYRFYLSDETLSNVLCFKFLAT